MASVGGEEGKKISFILIGMVMKMSFKTALTSSKIEERISHTTFSIVFRAKVIVSASKSNFVKKITVRIEPTAAAAMIISVMI